MASSIEAVHSGGSWISRPSSQTSARKTTQGLAWIPIALGTAVIVAGLGSRRKGIIPLAFTALAGVVAVAAMRDVQHGHGKADSKGQGASACELEVERSITVGKTVDELRRCWLDPKTLPQITAGFATLHPSGDRRMHWKVKGLLGHTLEWDSETVDDLPGQGIGWRSLPNATQATNASVRFHPAPADRGTVVTLRLRIDRPGGALGNAATKLLGATPLHLVVDGVLRRFKSLVETGEIPTTERQPAARADTR